MLSKLQETLSKKYNLILIFILALASFLRLYKISEYMTFLGDEGRDVLVVKHILQGEFTLLGPRASAGDFFLGPIYYYFMAPFLFIFKFNPVGPAVMIALMGILTVFLIYKVGAEIFNKNAGLIAAALYAISPIVIAYSRSSWNPNPMPLFSILTLWILLKAVQKKSNRLFILSGFLLGIAMQLHYLSTFLGAIMLVFILITGLFFSDKKTRTKKIQGLIYDYFRIFLGFIAGLSPFLFFEARHGFPNTKTILSFIFHSGEVTGGGKFFSIIGDVWFRIFGRLMTNFPPPEQVAIGAHQNIAVWYYLTILLGVTACLFFAFSVWPTVIKNEKTKLPVILLAVWAILGVLLFGFYKKSIYDYYFGFIFPVPFLLVGNLISGFLGKKLLFKILGLIILAVLLVVNILAAPFRSTPNNQYGQVKRISEFVLSKTDNKPFNFALITKGNSDHAYRYIFEMENHAPVMLENLMKDPQRKTATDQLLVICEDFSCNPLGYSQWEVAGFGRAEIVGEWDLTFVKVFKLIHYKGK